MPYKLVQVKDKWFVEDEDTGELKPEKGYDSKEDAFRLLRALYANVKDIERKAVRMVRMSFFNRTMKGGKGSGFFGHKGRPGFVGGSRSREEVDASSHGRSKYGRTHRATTQWGVEAGIVPSEELKRQGWKKQKPPLGLGNSPTGIERWDPENRKYVSVEATPMAHGVFNYHLYMHGGKAREVHINLDNLEDAVDIGNLYMDKDIVLTPKDVFEDEDRLVKRDWRSAVYGKSMLPDFLDMIVYFGSQNIKSLEASDGMIGAYSILFGSEEERDFHGNWFTKNTFLGHNRGNGAVATINHRMPFFKSGQFTPEVESHLMKMVARPMKNPVHTTVDEIGVFSTLVCDLSDKYERVVYDLARQGKLKWSSGTAPQLYEALPSGELKMFVIAEQALTPIPAEYRMLEHRVMPLKSYMDFLK